MVEYEEKEKKIQAQIRSGKDENGRKLSKKDIGNLTAQLSSAKARIEKKFEGEQQQREN